MMNDERYITFYLLRITYYAVLIFHVSLFTFHASLPAYSQQDPLTIAIVQPHDVSAYNQAVEGFLTQLGRSLKHDFNTVIYETPQGLYTALEKEKNASKPPGIDLILTVGTEATADVSRKIVDIPTVFTMVLDPENILKPRHDIVGASLNIPVELQFNMIKEILPAAENVGIIYDPTRNADFVKRSATFAEKFYLQIKLFPVTSQKDIPKALEKLYKQADILWGIVDNTVYTSQTAKFVIRDTVEKHIPFIGISASYVKAGALCALVFDNQDIGRQAAELATQILSGTPAATLQTTTPEKISIALNRRTAEIIGVTIPKNVLEQASIVYE